MLVDVETSSSDLFPRDIVHPLEGVPSLGEREVCGWLKIVGQKNFPAGRHVTTLLKSGARSPRRIQCSTLQDAGESQWRVDVFRGFDVERKDIPVHIAAEAVCGSPPIPKTFESSLVQHLLPSLN
jgi:hypothetical protein